MNIFLRVDASIHIGTGHVMRCLTLADKLKGQGATTAFICRHITEPLKQLICENGHTLVFLPQHDPALISEDSLLAHAKWIGVPQSIDAKDTLLAIGETTCDFLIVDHYALDIRWESALRQSAKKIMVIDDIADRQHDCDVLLDQNYYFDMQDRYLNLISVNTQKLLGPKYALLNQAFIDSSQNICHKTGLVKRVLVFFGGIDKDNYTQLVLEALVKLALPNIKVDVIIGSQHPNREGIVQICEQYAYTCHVQTNNVAKIMAAADIALASGGIAIWERACLGLPTISIPLADNQKKQIKDLAADGYLYSFDADLSNLKEKICVHFQALFENSSLREFYSVNSMELVDGRGCNRVLRALGLSEINLRLAKEEDSENLFTWRNHEVVRMCSFNTDLIAIEMHNKWFANLIADKNRFLLIGKKGTEDIGVIRFDINDEVAEISIYLIPKANKVSKGLGAELLAVGEAWLNNIRPSIKKFKANVLSKNMLSSNLFETAGYKQITKTYYKDINI